MVCAIFLLITAAVVIPVQPGRAHGSIEGSVTNASTGDLPVGGAEVVLRVRIEGKFVSVERTTTAADGSFRFSGLPVGTGDPYLPGANHDEVHFPGGRVLLTAAQPHARVDLKVFDATSDSPLVVESHSITLQAQAGFLSASETMVVSNPSSRCYVGQPQQKGGVPVTLRLGIPSAFERVTFQKEAFGRQFALRDGQLLTSIPWPPGKRELSFTYVIPNNEQHYLWERALDLSSSRVSLTILTDSEEDVECNLQRFGGPQSGLRFESATDSLPAGYVVRARIGQLPIPTIVLARCAASLLLLSLVVTAGIVSIRRRQLIAVPQRSMPGSAEPGTDFSQRSSRELRKCVRGKEGKRFFRRRIRSIR